MLDAAGTGAAIRVAVLVKQVPLAQEMALGPDGRLQRAGHGTELNAYCRRAIAKGTELAAANGGSCTVITLGPPSAADCLREAVAWGATAGVLVTGVLVTDPEFAGSDTLATARALAAALGLRGPFDLVLTGRNSIDADTGQVGPAVAELLGLPFIGGVRELAVPAGGLAPGSEIVARCEHDDGWASASVTLPAVLSCAERLCAPAKMDQAGRDAVDPAAITLLRAADLGPGPFGQAGSPTRVGEVRVHAVSRRGLILDGPVAEQVRRAVAELHAAGALPPAEASTGHPPDSRGPGGLAEPVPDGWERGESGVAVVCEPQRDQETRELLGAAARLARQVSGRVIAVDLGGTPADLLSAWGADEVVRPEGVTAEEDVARVIGDWCCAGPPWAMLFCGTMWGREVAARLAARLGAGLTGDAVTLSLGGGRLIGWKPAFGGQLVAAVTSQSPAQLVTIRPGVLRAGPSRASRDIPVRVLTGQPVSRVRLLDAGRDDDIEVLPAARRVIGVGAGISPQEYGALRPLLAALGGELAATRKVTDKGWLPRSRQLGLTGRSIGPDLYIAIGLSGKYNHMVGVRGAGTVLAINTDSSAPVFTAADIGIVADWHDVVPLLAAAIAAGPA